MKVFVDLENGTQHELTETELRVLQLAIEAFPESTLPLCSPKREEQYTQAWANLKALFLAYL